MNNSDHSKYFMSIWASMKIVDKGIGSFVLLSNLKMTEFYLKSKTFYDSYTTCVEPANDTSENTPRVHVDTSSHWEIDTKPP